MKLFAASIAGLALIASPAVAQTTNNTSAAQTNVQATTTTKHVHATNVPMRKHHGMRHHRMHHHAVRCGCPPSHMKGHHTHAHHMVKKTTTTTTKS
jgi:hypothetical protein